MAAKEVPTGKAAEVYAHQFYDALLERAKTETIIPAWAEDEGDGRFGLEELPTEAVVYRGKITELFRELGLSQIYYTKSMKIFRTHNCITYLQRGTKAYDTVIILNHPPPPVGSEDFTKQSLTDEEGSASLEEVARRVAALEDWRETTAGGLNIGDALREHEKQLAAIRKQLTEGVNANTDPQTQTTETSTS